jgi:hypothetical protein
MVERVALMHINGFASNQKLAIVEHLQVTFGDKIIVKDVDEFLTNKSTKKSMEREIGHFMSLHTKPVVLVGTVVNEPLKKLYPHINARHKVWLDVSLQAATEQILQRQLDWLCAHNRGFLDMSRKMTHAQLKEYLNKFYNFRQLETQWQPLHQLCKDLGYKNMTGGQITSTIRKDLRLH